VVCQFTKYQKTRVYFLDVQNSVEYREEQKKGIGLELEICKFSS
jgi:hypothetical protein